MVKSLFRFEILYMYITLSIPQLPYKITLTLWRVLQVRMALVDQDVSVSCLIGHHVDDSLVSILERLLLDPRMHILLNAQVQHFLITVSITPS